MTTQTNHDLRETVRQRYGEYALKVTTSSESASCCGSSSACCSEPSAASEAIGSVLYSIDEKSELPEAAVLASLGCGNPTALADLKAGETVLDLGSGGGIDVLLSARRVGPTGFAYGLDMTDEMLALAEQNRIKAGAENVRFLRGHIEEIPLPDNSVDVIISNCVINLSVDKDRVLREAFRILKPGGRFAVSDIVTEGSIEPSLRADMEAYVGCIAGALDRDDYVRKLEAAGFVEASVEETQRLSYQGGGGGCCTSDPGVGISKADASTPGILSAFIRATKPNV